MTEEARITALYSEDLSTVPQMVAARPNVILQRPQGKGVAVFFHENPAYSNVPSGKELRRLCDSVELEQYEPPVQGESHAEGEGVHEGEETETRSEEEGGSKKASGKKKGRR